MTDNDQRWTVAAAALQDRLNDLLWPQAELVRRSGLSEPTIKSVIEGTFRNGAPRSHTLAKIGQAVGWPRNWVDLAAAGEPIPTTTPPPVADSGMDASAMLEIVRRLDAVTTKLEALLDPPAAQGAPSAPRAHRRPAAKSRGKN